MSNAAWAPAKKTHTHSQHDGNGGTLCSGLRDTCTCTRMLSKSHAFKRTSTCHAAKHVHLEHKRCRSSSRVVERPPRPPPPNKDVGGEGSPLMCHTTQHHSAATRSSAFVRGSANPCKMTCSRLAPNERGLLAKMTNAKSESEGPPQGYVQGSA